MPFQGAAAALVLRDFLDSACSFETLTESMKLIFVHYLPGANCHASAHDMGLRPEPSSLSFHDILRIVGRYHRLFVLRRRFGGGGSLGRVGVIRRSLITSLSLRRLTNRP